jgi:hypothetical protein
VKKNAMLMQTLKKTMLVSSPGGEMRATLLCPRVKLNIRGVEFIADLIVLNSSGIDVILGMNWLILHEAVIQCATRTILLKTETGERVEFKAEAPIMGVGHVNQMKGAAVTDIPIVNEFPDVFPADLPGMPPEREVEFIIELLPGTAPIAKRPYRMGVNELEELKKQIRELQDKGYIRPSSSPWGHLSYLLRKRMGRKECA